LIPIVNVTFTNTADADGVRVASAILGSIVLASTGLLQLSKSHEGMIIFRIVTARIQKEYYLFLKRIGDYSRERERARQQIHTMLTRNMLTYFVKQRLKPEVQTQRLDTSGKRIASRRIIS
jgi:hypothetical protein